MTKRFLDVLVASAAILISAPLLGLAALAVAVGDRGPVLFRQARAGQDGKVFNLYKLRSMRLNDLPVSHVGQVGEGHHLVTRVGRILRRWKIDELPQLFNVVLGDMSLIGPRPTVPDQVEQYDRFQRRRLDVRPGMTGWAQVNGNVELSWNDRILLDVWYVDHRSFLLDVRILFRTAQVVLRGERPNTSAVEIAKSYADSSGRGSR